MTQQFQLRTDEGSNSSSCALGIKIAWFIMEGQLVFKCMVAEQLAWSLKERTKHPDTAPQLPAILHASKAFGARASNQSQQD